MEPPLSRVAHLWSEVAIARTPQGPLEFARAGSGPCVLVIHGTPGSWRQCFSMAADFADAFTVVAPSRPGYGRTPIATGRTYSEQADAYAALLDSLDIDRVAIIGASGGGPSSIAFAERFPDRTSSLSLICAMDPFHIEIPPALAYLIAPRGIGEAFSVLSRFVARTRLKNEDPKTVAKWLSTMFTPEEQAWIAADPSIRDALLTFAWTHQEAPAGLAGLRNDMAQVRATQRGAEPIFAVSAPTLVLHGEADETCPISHAEGHARRIAGAVLERYAGAGHTFFLTRRAEVTARLRAFFVETSRASR